MPRAAETEFRRAPEARPPVPNPVRAVTEATFAGLARLLDARALHPRGRSFAATLAPIEGQRSGLFEQPRRALVRLSNAAGLPAWSPDVLGLGIRILDGVAPGRPQDLLLSSSAEPPVLRHVLVPARSFATPRFSSLLLYRHAGARMLVGARYSGPPADGGLRLADADRTAAEGRLRFTLAISRVTGPWQPIAELHLRERLSVAESEALRFHPWNTSPLLRPVGLVNRLRGPAYEASQRAASSE